MGDQLDLSNRIELLLRFVLLATADADLATNPRRLAARLEVSRATAYRWSTAWRDEADRDETNKAFVRKALAFGFWMMQRGNSVAASDVSEYLHTSRSNAYRWRKAWADAVEWMGRNYPDETPVLRLENRTPASITRARSNAEWRADCNGRI